MSDEPEIDPGESSFSGPAPSESSADQIDLICDAFEQAWSRGESPQIEAFLEQGDRSMREPLFQELLLVERELRIRYGQAASRGDYQQRFPEYSRIIDALDFATIDDRRRATAQGLGTQSLSAVGMKLAQFELLEELGSGASGIVWKAKDSRLQRMVAIKTPRLGTLTASERERFLREGQACAQLRHANIVAVHEVGEDRGQAFIVAEFIDGANLRDWLKLRKPTAVEAAELAAQIAEALHHAHEQGVIHRDLKPANVLIDREGRPHITDFGLAKWTMHGAGLTVDGHIVGTPAYMSPEQARGESNSVDRRTDVYGLGALLYELLTGQPAFDGDVSSVVHQVIHNEPEAPRKIESRVPRDLETICLKAMEKDPQRRYQSAQELAVDLRRYLRGEPILARPVSPVEKGWRFLRRRPAVALSLVLAILSLGLLGVTQLLAEKNYELLGLQTVTLTTEPPGAKVAFVPLDPQTGEPQFLSTVFSRGESPVQEELKPGDYFVVAVLQDGRFHEVFRHVPGPTEPVPGAYGHRFSVRSDDGVVSLPGIEIPDARVVSEMAFIEGDRRDSKESRNLIESFYVDPHEFTFEDYTRVVKRIPARFGNVSEPKITGMPAKYDEAVSCAEKVGKRLPTAAEFEFAATSRGRYRYPWGNEFPADAVEASFDPVTKSEFDVLAADVPVVGLCSKRAEWTSTWVAPPSQPLMFPEAVSLKEYRIVCGGTMTTVQGKPGVDPSIRDPRNRCRLVVYANYRGLGFRCVRSARPAISYSDFP